VTTEQNDELKDMNSGVGSAPWAKQQGSIKDCIRVRVAGGWRPSNAAGQQCGNFCPVYSRGRQGDLFTYSGKPVGEACYYSDVS